MTFSSATDACAKGGGQWEQALQLLVGMPAAKVSLNVQTFSSAISACAKGGQWEQALKLFDDMQAEKVSPNVVTFNSALDACARGGGHWEQVLKFFLPSCRPQKSSPTS